MSILNYTHAANELRDLRELFYRTRLQRGERLSLAETNWLFGRDMQRTTLSLKLSVNEAMKAIADFAKQVRELRATITGFPQGGDTVRR